MAMTVRQARDGDADRIAELLSQLGYPVAASEIPRRLAALGQSSGVAYVAVDEAGHVMGVGSAMTFATLHSDACVAYITALVADASTRGQGVGRAIVCVIEDWARSRGATRLTVTSAEHREGAHAFYPAIGFPYTGRRFSKSLSS